MHMLSWLSRVTVRIQQATISVFPLDPIQLYITSSIVSYSMVKVIFNSSALHTIIIRATDNAGCVKEDSVTFNVGGMCVYHWPSTIHWWEYFIETRPPKITLNSLRRNVQNNCILVDYSLSQSATTDCSYDNGPWTKCKHVCYSIIVWHWNCLW